MNEFLELEAIVYANNVIEELPVGITISELKKIIANAYKDGYNNNVVPKKYPDWPTLTKPIPTTPNQFKVQDPVPFPFTVIC